MVVINHKTTKFESNSQLPVVASALSISCYQSQNYKIWKQFTTVWCHNYSCVMLLSIAKLQNLKAIHNRPVRRECNVWVVINRKTTKFESNSQQKQIGKVNSASCYQSQNYKIWKQFTTPIPNVVSSPPLLSIAKLQNLKAIHNYSSLVKSFNVVVINRKTTKFESNSQRAPILSIAIWRCYQSQNYKIWKQFTTTIAEVRG